MMKLIRSAALAVFGVALATSAPVLAQGYMVNPPDPYVHKSVGVEMPAEAAGLIRNQVAEYDEDGSDASATYFANDDTSRFTIYIYPTRGMGCEQTFKGAKAAIDQHRGSKLQKKAPPIVVDSLASFEQMSAQYAIPANTYGSSHPKLKSELWLGCVPGGEWFVKYRGSYIADDEQFDDIARRFIASFDWSPLTRPTERAEETEELVD